MAAAALAQQNKQQTLKAAQARFVELLTHVDAHAGDTAKLKREWALYIARLPAGDMFAVCLDQALHYLDAHRNDLQRVFEYLRCPNWTRNFVRSSKVLASVEGSMMYPFVLAFDPFAHLEEIEIAMCSAESKSVELVMKDAEEATEQEKISAILDGVLPLDKQNEICCKKCGGRVTHMTSQDRRSDEGESHRTICTKCRAQTRT